MFLLLWFQTNAFKQSFNHFRCFESKESEINAESNAESKSKQNKLKKFPELIGKVLRFNGYFRIQFPYTDDSRDLILIYYLSDDTIQINQIIEPNSGFDGSSIFLRRMKIPINWSLNANLPGNETNLSILNVLGENFLKGRFVTDKQAMFKNKMEYLKVV